MNCSRAVAFAAVFAFVLASKKFVTPAGDLQEGGAYSPSRATCIWPPIYRFSEVEIARESDSLDWSRS
jgi:hypothetical protein